MIYPWQHAEWQQLQQAVRDNRLPHAILLVGMRGLGKAHFAECFMRAQLCQQSRLDESCRCHSCCLIKGKSHPNVLWIEPEKVGGAIKVDQVREVTEFVNQTSLQGEYRFVLIHPASHMNINAANALLKTLEEPASGAILILITEQASHLPATIVSRCQPVHFRKPPEKLALDWLAQRNSSNPQLVLRLAQGAPLAALELLQEEKLTSRRNLLNLLYSLSQKQTDPLQAAAGMESMELLAFLDVTLGLIMDVLRLQLLANESDVTNQDFLPQLRDLQQRVQRGKIIPYLDEVIQLRGHLQKGINLNKPLMMEERLIRWMECM